MAVCNQSAVFFLLRHYHAVLKPCFAGRVNRALVAAAQFEGRTKIGTQLAAPGTICEDGDIC
jgi:hypothetical protein